METVWDYYRLAVSRRRNGPLGLTQFTPLGWLFLSSSGVVSHGRIQDSGSKPLWHSLQQAAFNKSHTHKGSKSTSWRRQEEERASTKDPCCTQPTCASSTHSPPRA